MTGKAFKNSFSGKKAAKVWDIWLADVKFEGLAGHKLRPVVVTGYNGSGVEALQMTTHEIRYQSDVKLCEPQAAGLEKDTVVKTGSKVSLVVGCLQIRLGRLSRMDIDLIRSVRGF